MKSGIELIAAERERQVSAEGFTLEHDDIHYGSELVIASNGYASLAAVQARGTQAPPCYIPRCWPWQREWWKPSPDPIRNLVKAGALIAAEIDRLQRLENNRAES